MKASLLILISSFLFCLHSLAFDRGNKDAGIQFFEGSWAELLKLAKQENKPIFLDVYTDWCPPCKQMDKEVMPLPEVGDMYNGSFINFKLNAEKGEGVEIAKRYDVKAYPTYLFLDEDGYLLHRAVGYFDKLAFIAHAEKALNEVDKNVLSHFEKQFKEGNRESDFLRDYISNLTSLGLNNTEVLNAYFERTPIGELSTRNELLFLTENINSADANALTFLIENYEKLDEDIQSQLTPKLFSLLHSASGVAWKEGKPLEFKQALNYLDLLTANLSQKEMDGLYRVKLLYAVMVKDTALTKKTGYRMVDKLMDVPFDSIKAEDKRRYNQIMEPYWSGKEDSTKIEGFQEEKQYILAIYSNEIAYKLFEASKAFVAVLDGDDPALKDAVIWIDQLNLLLPDTKLFLELKDRIKKRMYSPET